MGSQMAEPVLRMTGTLPGFDQAGPGVAVIPPGRIAIENAV